MRNDTGIDRYAMTYISAYNTAGTGLYITPTDDGTVYGRETNAVVVDYYIDEYYQEAYFEYDNFGVIEYIGVNYSDFDNQSERVYVEDLYAYDSNWNTILEVENFDQWVSADSTSFDLLSGSDTILGNDYRDVIKGASGDDVISGYGGNDTLVGGSGQDTLSGGAGHDALSGGTGADKMAGGTGSDTYVVQHTGDTVSEDYGSGWDTVISTVNFALNQHSYYLEDLDLAGTGNIAGIGNGLSNTIDGNAGHNRLNGAWGDDVLHGRGGNDLFIDSAGADTMYGGTGNDRYFVDNTGDAVVEEAGNGWDRVDSSVSFSLGEHSQHLELLNLIGQNDVDAVGNGKNNPIFGNSGDNVLNGAAGNDYLIGGKGDDTFADDAGADRMAGAQGNDLYYIDNAGDRVVEHYGNGWDRVDSEMSVSLREHSHHIEVLNLIGSDDVDGTGNGIANRMFGNSGDNTLHGAAQGDTIVGGAGSDRLIGGRGDDHLYGHGLSDSTNTIGEDVFVFTDGHGDDTVASVGGGDKLDFSGLSSLNSWDDVQAAMSGDSDQTVIDTGADSSITVKSVGVSDFDGDEFVF